MNLFQSQLYPRLAELLHASALIRTGLCGALSRIQAQLPYTALAARPTAAAIQSLTLLLILVTMIMTISENDTHHYSCVKRPRC